MYQSKIAQRHHQTDRSALAMPSETGRGLRRSSRLVVGALLGATLVLVAQGGWAAGSLDNNLDSSLVNKKGGDDSAFSKVAPAGNHALISLDDGALASIRGRYVDARAVDGGASDDGGFVILWDEHPVGGGGGNDNNKSLSNGLGNYQSTSVTTRRGQ